MDHSFDVDVAKIHGIEAAIIVKNLQYWIKHNKANGTHFHDGKTWTYNSLRAWGDLFPYMSPSALKRTINKLCDVGLLVRGNYNKNPYDKTTWYAFGDESKWLFREKLPIVENPPIDELKPVDLLVKISQSLTDNKPDNNPDDNPLSESKDSVSQNSLFDVVTPDNSPSKTPTKKRARGPKPVDECYTGFVKQWCEAYPELQFDGISGKVINRMVVKTRNHILGKNEVPTKESVESMFSYILAYVKRVSHWVHGKPITTFDTQFTSVIFEITNGKQQKQTPASSARDYINNL